MNYNFDNNENNDGIYVHDNIKEDNVNNYVSNNDDKSIITFHTIRFFSEDFICKKTEFLAFCDRFVNR